MAEWQDINGEHAQRASQLNADVGVEHVADVYAQALLGAGENAGRTAELLAEFDSLIADVLQPFPKLEAILASGLLGYEEKERILDRVFGGRASPLLIHFLKVVARHGRLDCLKAIHRQFHAQYDKLRGRIRVQVTTACPLSTALAGRITENLRVALGGQPVIEHLTAPELIGGMVVRVGDTVYDGSVANQLQVLREQMLDRSVHEIQSRRDRFRYPAGN